MTNTFRLFWRLFFYGVMVVLLLDAKATEPWGFMILGVALSLGFYKSEALIKENRQRVGQLFFALEWLLLILAMGGHSPYLVIGTAVLLAEWCWISLTKAKTKIKIVAAFLAIALSYPLIPFLTSPTDMTTVVLQFLLSALILWLGLVLNDMQARKIAAQQYYDQLRESEIALKNANVELEAYYETLEEVTILRERNRISRDIHDNVGHALATTLIQLQAIEHRMQGKQDPDSVIITTLTDFVRTSLATTRQIVRDMVPKMLSYKKFKIDLTELCNQSSKLTGLQVILTMPDTDLSLTENHHECLFQCVKEGLTNAMKHGQARSVRVILTVFDSSVCLTIRDDGIGTNLLKPSFGLEAMRSRIETMKGNQLIESAPNQGFTIKVTLPREIVI